MSIGQALFYFIIITAYVANAETQTTNQCCLNGVQLKKIDHCTDGSKPTISCDDAAILDPSLEDFTYDENNNLVFGSEVYELGKYCMTKLKENGSEVAILCVEYTFAESKLSYIIRAVCALITSICLLLTILVYILVPTLRDVQGKCIMHALCGLTAAFIIMSIIQFNTSIHETACIILPFAMYFFFMIAFFWLNILSYNKWKTVVNPRFLRNTRDSFRNYCVYGYGVPFLLLLISLITHHVSGNHIKPGFGNNICWFDNRQATWVYFYGPLSILLAANVFFFVWTAKVLWSDIGENHPKCSSLKYRFFLYLKLFIIMGLTWIFEVLSFAFDNNKTFVDYIWIVTDYINALQGILILIILVILRKKALRGLAAREVLCLKFPKKWTTLKDEECDESEEVRTSLSQDH